MKFNLRRINNLMICLCSIIISVLIFGGHEVKASTPAMNIKSQGHVQDIGWMPYVDQGNLVGTTGKCLRVEGLKFYIENPLSGVKVKYQAHVQDIGWMPWAYNGAMVGTTGRSLRIEALKVQLEGAPANYHVEYQAHVENIGWMPWVKDGQVAGTTGSSLRVEAIRVKIVVDSEPTPTVEPKLSYRGHVSNVGWTGYVGSDTQVGVVNNLQNQIEAIGIKLDNATSTMKVKYDASVNGIGWQGVWKENGQVAGTTGQARAMEAIKVKLEGLPADYHIVYRTYIRGQGWQGWVADGAISGVVGKGDVMEAIDIKLVKTTNVSQYVKPKVAVDIGHNVAYDGGAVGIRKEDDVVKEVGNRLINKLRLQGYTVIEVLPKSATSQRDALLQRTNIANINEADLYISIHFNAFNGEASGTEVYNHPTKLDATSTSLAQNIVANIAALGFKNRGVKQADYAVLRESKMPAVLVECCFVDSQSDMERYDPESMATAIFNGIIKTK